MLANLVAASGRAEFKGTIVIKKRGIFRWRRRILVCLCVLAGAALAWVIGQQLGANQVIAGWQAEREAIRKGKEDAAAIERNDAAAARLGASRVPPRLVTVAELFDAFRTDPQAAQRTYGEGKLEVAGQVARVVGTSGEATIEFVSPAAGKTVSAIIAPEDAELISLVRPGAKISVLCGSVATVAAVPELSDCRF